jgi:hypothetical protein
MMPAYNLSARQMEELLSYLKSLPEESL